jgi:hypothetical protein
MYVYGIGRVASSVCVDRFGRKACVYRLMLCPPNEEILTWQFVTSPKISSAMSAYECSAEIGQYTST